MRKMALTSLLASVVLTLASCGDTTQPEPASNTLASDGVDLPMPAAADIQPRHASWDVDDSIDPLLVKDANVMDLDRSRQVEKLKVELAMGEQLDGISFTRQLRPILDSQGNPLLDTDGNPESEVHTVTQYWFKGHDHPYREGDTVDGTDFVIPKGWNPSNTPWSK